jgi:hypothetical protein
MMRRIEAEERLAAIDDGAIAAGNVRRPEAMRATGELRRAAHGGARPKPAKAPPGALAAMGIAVVSAPSSPAEKAPSDG